MGCSHWVGKMIWDEQAQIILVIDSMMVKTCDAATGTTRHCINRAHEAPVTVGLWFGENESIVTGCVGGGLNIWACQHSDLKQHNGRKLIRRRSTKRKPRRRRARRRSSGQRVHSSPALIASFKAHSGAVTGLVRHCTNKSWVVSSSTDDTLRIWDVDGLAGITTVRLDGRIASLWTHRVSADRSRLVCTGPEGRVTTMDVHEISEPFGDGPQRAQRIHYYPSVDSSENDGGISTVATSFGGRFVGEKR